LTLPLVVAIFMLVRVMVGLIISPWARRYSMLKRFILLLAVTALVVMLVVTAGPTFAGEQGGTNYGGNG
jgi:hypothetical protein